MNNEYTHYWKTDGTAFDANLFSKFSNAVKKVISKVQANGIVIGNAMGDDLCPIINEKTISFNGYGDDADEALLIDRDITYNFYFCKTSRKPYDVAVVATLLLYKYFFPSIIFTSDGILVDLQEARKMVADVLGIKVVVTDKAEIEINT